MKVVGPAVPEKKEKKQIATDADRSSFESFILSEQSRLEGGVVGVCASRIALRFLFQLSVEVSLLLAEP